MKKGNRPERRIFKEKEAADAEVKKVCVFCGKENNEIDYKDVAKLRKYISERGKNPSEKNLQETVQSIRELLQLQLKEQDILL